MAAHKLLRASSFLGRGGAGQGGDGAGARGGCGDVGGGVEVVREAVGRVGGDVRGEESAGSGYHRDGGGGESLKWTLRCSVVLR